MGWASVGCAGWQHRSDHSVADDFCGDGVGGDLVGTGWVRADRGECRLQASSNAPAGGELNELLGGEVGDIDLCAAGQRVGR